MSVVVNIRVVKEGWLYIGRAGQGQSGYFGNPVVVGRACSVCGEVHHGGGETLPCFRRYLWTRLGRDEIFRERLWGIRNQT